jgi:hypothetical protein
MMKNLRNMHEQSFPPTGAQVPEGAISEADGTLRTGPAGLQLEGIVQGKGPHTGGCNDRLVRWRMW